MAKEKPAYRDNLEDILEYTEGRRMLTLAEVARYLGKDRRWVEEFVFKPCGKKCKDGISAMTLARQLA